MFFFGMLALLNPLIRKKKVKRPELLGLFEENWAKT
jgi:hypothetical protein